MPVIKAVVFDVGETLVSEDRAWHEEARRVDLPATTFLAALGAVIERGGDHREVWDVLGVERTAPPIPIQRDDFYPDAIPCLDEAKRAGLLVGLAGNQPEGVAEVLESLNLPVDFIASSAQWGVSKPDPAFFGKVIEAAGLAAPAIAYVGDRLDNDVLPAATAGLYTVFLRRGPWGFLHARRPEAARADLRIEDLSGLVAHLTARPI